MVRRQASPGASENGFDIAGSLIPDDESETDGREFGASANTGREFESAAEITLNSDDSDDGDDEAFIAAQQAASNRKSSSVKSKTGKRGGGFQAMGLNPALLKAISRKGFSVPTPIQRKTVPLILSNHDVVGMARTGSGKTAAFVIPMVEKLKTHSVTVGARALILSPSRELALQTLKAVKEFGRGADLRTTLLVGGESLEDQFSQMSNNPDIIIATPGRFLHLLVEMSLDLSSIRYVVFDEADRLFEMGFASQLREILNALPPSRQTLLFSATLPANLIEFANAGLRDPNLVRLDAESKISPDLENTFLTVKPAEKEGALLHILTDLIKIPPGLAKDSGEPEVDSRHRLKKRKRESTETASHGLSATHSTVIFAATKHHVEYLAGVLRASGFDVSYVYGSLDQAARRSQVERFRNGETSILVVTDVAARGIDIPLLANVINYAFPSQPKIFVHRVGRTARAGRKGWSYNLVQSSDVPYLLDLQLFLGRKLVLGRNHGTQASFTDDIIVGRIPRGDLEKHMEVVGKLVEEDEDIAGLRSVAAKGEKLYTRTRNAASLESVRRAKQIGAQQSFHEHNLIYDKNDTSQVDRDDMLARISGFRPSETVFELGRQKGGARTEAAKAAEAMRSRRLRSKQKALASNGVMDENGSLHADPEVNGNDIGPTDQADSNEDSSSSEEELEVTYTSSHSRDDLAEKNQWQDPANFMSYAPTQSSLAEKQGYGVHTGSNQSSRGQVFLDAARDVALDLNNDESRSFAEPSRPKQMRWDKRGKKYVSRANDEDGSKGRKMITGESGQKIPASFRSGRFDAWKRSNKMERLPRVGEQESNKRGSGPGATGRKFKHHAARAPKQPDKYRDDYYKKKKKVDAAKAGDGGGRDQGRTKNELRGVDDVRRQRHVKDKRREKNARQPRKKGTASLA